MASEKWVWVLYVSKWPLPWYDVHLHESKRSAQMHLRELRQRGFDGKAGINHRPVLDFD